MHIANFLEDLEFELLPKLLASVTELQVRVHDLALGDGADDAELRLLVGQVRELEAIVTTLRATNA